MAQVMDFCGKSAFLKLLLNTGHHGYCNIITENSASYYVICRATLPYIVMKRTNFGHSIYYVPTCDPVLGS